MNRTDRLIAQVYARCSVIAELVQRMQPFYRAEDTIDYQRQHVETIVGAGLWYIPNSGLWTGRVSRAAIASYHPNEGEKRPKLTQDHYYPRKAAARELLNTDWSTVDDPAYEVTRRYIEVYGRFNHITPSENRALMPYQKVDRFVTPEQAYASAGVVLVAVSPEELQRIKGRDEHIIDALLNGSA